MLECIKLVIQCCFCLQLIRETVNEMKDKIYEILAIIKSPGRHLAVQAGIEEPTTPERSRRLIEQQARLEKTLEDIFPLSEFNAAAEKLLENLNVRNFLQYKVMKEIYAGHAPGKVDYHSLVTTYLNIVVTRRFQAHCGRPLRLKCQTSKFAFSKMPVPAVIYDTFETHIRMLGVPLAQDSLGKRWKDILYEVSRTELYSGNKFKEVDTLETLAAMMFHEKKDWYARHKVMLSNEKLICHDFITTV